MVASTLAESYVELAARESGAVVEQAGKKLSMCFLTTTFNQLKWLIIFRTANIALRQHMFFLKPNCLSSEYR